MTKLKIANIVFQADNLNDYTLNECKDYIYSGKRKPEFEIELTSEDIDFESSLAEKLPKIMMQSIALYRKLIEKVIEKYNGTVIHCSSISVDNEAYIFTAPSGTGKSTHTRLWREYFGDRAIMINDDKPLVRYERGGFFVYGTPWEGKENIGNNIKVKLKAIVFLCRGEENSIHPFEAKKGVIPILRQTLMPSTTEQQQKLFDFIDILVKKVPLYKLYCNTSLDAVATCYKGINKKEMIK